MKTSSGITVRETPYADVMKLLKCDTLTRIEDHIAKALGEKICFEYGTAVVSYVQADVSVSGMTCQDIERYLLESEESLVRFALAGRYDDEEQEYPPGEESDPEELDDVEEEMLGAGFIINHVIYHNFLVNHTLPELIAYLKNRRIPQATKFAKQLSACFEAIKD